MEKNTMKLQHIELSQLKVSPVNVRKRGADEDLGCPSSDNLRLIRLFEKGGSGSSVVGV